MKFVKIVSNNTGDWTTSRNRIDLTIPATLGMVNLERSYLMLETEIESDLAVDNVCLGNGTDVYRADALIKNIRASTDKHGVIEERNQHNILQTNLNAFVLNNDIEYSEAYAQGAVAKNRFGMEFSAFRDLKTQGTVPSTKKACELVIPLKRVLGICNETQYPVLTGSLDLRLELEDIFPVVKQILNYTIGSELDLEAQLVGTHTTATALLARDHKLYVGATVIVSCDVNGSPVADVETTITELALNQTTGTLTITFADAYGGAAGAVTNVKLVEKETTGLKYKVSQAHVVVLQDNLIKPEVVPIQFPMWSLERINMPATTDFQRQYQVEPMCSGAMLLTPSATNLLSKQANMTDYRFMVNGKNDTDRVVPLGSKFDLDRKIQGLNSMGERIYDLSNTEVKIPMLPLRENENGVLLQANVRFSPAGDAGVAYLYKKVEKLLNF